MNNSISGKFIIIAAVLMLAAACAKISSPSGGPVDRTPPVVLESIPANNSRNFREKEIRIEFDEYVVLDNINEKFMVSPPMKKKPKVFTRGKGIRIQYEEDLRDSTTYTFYFLDAIRDLNAGNILDNYKFVISTGNVIDSLSVTGNVYTAVDLEIPEKTQVMMYSNKEDSAVRKTIPDYITRVDQTGYFRIDNIKPGQYRLYALKDDDNSKTYNRVEEAFAFLDTLITVSSPADFIPVPKDTSTAKPVKQTLKTTNSGNRQVAQKKPEIPARLGTYKLILYNGEKKNHYLTGSSRDVKYQFRYFLSLPPDTMDFHFSIPGVTPEKYIIENSRHRDTMTVWLTDSLLYKQELISAVLKYPFTDTLGILGYKTDTVPMRSITPRTTRFTKKTVPVLSLESNMTGGGVKPGETVAFRSKTPLREPDTTRVKLYQLVEKTRSRIPYALVKDTSSLNRYYLRAKLAEGSQYLFIADSAAFTDIYGVSTDSTGVRFLVRQADSYGTLEVSMTNVSGSSIVQLLDKSEKLRSQKTISNDGKLVFPLLEKDSYRLRIIYDADGNREWTTGDFDAGRQPEASSYYRDEIEIKEGWVQDQDWDVSERNFKDQKMRKKQKQ